MAIFEIQPYWQDYIDGKFVDGGSGRIAVDDPATGEVIAHHALADRDDVDRAVQAAKRCHESVVLADLRTIERGRMVRKMGEYILDHRDEIEPVLTLAI